MRKYNIPPAFSSSLQLGRQGENGVTEITFLCAGYAKMYGDGFAEAVHRTPDGTTYPVNIEQDENNRVSWLISDGDTATAGTGQLELRWMVNGNLAKSKIFSTIIKSALTAPETPPDAAKSWVDKVLKAAEDIKAGAIDDEKLAKAIAEYLEKHPIESGITEQKAREIAQNVVDAYQEKDPTVPDWAKSETKPTYTAAEVGAVPESAKSDIDKNTSARHTHSNKSALDSISESDISKWNSGTAGTVEITGATGLAAGSAPTVTEAADSTAQARKYQLGIPAGKDGADGQPGTSGKSAYQYAQEGGYTGTEAEFAAKLAEEMPDALRNPNALTFTGAVTGTYDGSAPLEVAIPSGGGESGDYIPNPSTASVGQTIVVKAVDENGKPTEWEAADMASGGGEREWALIEEITLEETVSKVEKVLDTPCDELLVVFSNLLSTPNNSIGVGISINGVAPGDTGNGMFTGAFVHNSAPARGIIQIVKAEDYWYGIVSGINSGVNANGIGITRPSTGRGKTKIESFNFWVSNPVDNSICAGATLKIYTR